MLFRSAAAALFSQSAGNVNASGPMITPKYIPAAGALVTNLKNVLAQLNQDSTGLTASGLLFGGVAPVDTVANAVILEDSGVVPTLDGFLTDDGTGASSFHAHGTCGYNAAGAPATGFGFGNWALLVLELVSTNGGDVLSFANLSMSLREVG